MGALGSIIDLYAAEAESGMAWFLYLFIFLIVTIKTHIPFPSHHILILTSTRTICTWLQSLVEPQ